MEESASPQSSSNRTTEVPTITVPDAWNWDRLLEEPTKAQLEQALAARISLRRWFGARSRRIRNLSVIELIPLTTHQYRLALVQVEFEEGRPEIYQLPLAIAEGDEAARLLSDEPAHLWARVDLPGGGPPAVLYEALVEPEFRDQLLRLFENQSHCPGQSGELAAWQAEPFARLLRSVQRPMVSTVVSAEQSNSSVIYSDRLILKVLRRVETGISPDVEINRYLTAHGFANAPALAGGLDYRRNGGATSTLGVAQGFVSNRGDAWQYTLEHLKQFLEESLGRIDREVTSHVQPADGLCDAAIRAMPAAVEQLFGKFLVESALLGTRTAQLHLTLASEKNDPAFAPELFSSDDQSQFVARARDSVTSVFELLKNQQSQLSPSVGKLARDVLDRESTLHERWNQFAAQPIHVNKIRCHGDYHLGQVLVSADDFMIIDFEGEPARALSERRAKLLALRDVAGMIRSYHYASCSATHQVNEKLGQAASDSLARLGRAWYFWTSVAFLAAYRRDAGAASFLPSSADEFQRLLEACLLEKAVYELQYELNNRPDWVYLPLEALGNLLNASSANDSKS